MSTIDGEEAFPIYSFGADWHEEGEQKEHSRVEGLPEGRIWNMMSGYHMFREELSPSRLRLELMKWWANSIACKRRDGGPSISKHDPSTPILEGKQVLTETWCGTWFSHWTFDQGQSDEEARESFWQYVNRMEIYNRQHGKMVGEPGKQYPQEPFCLMGAEDRWRWHSETDDGERVDQVPCRCKHCKKAGVLRIGH